MPRVYQKVKNAGGHKIYVCAACRKPVRSGQPYFTWKFNRGLRHFQHVSCGMPRRSSLTNSKMSAVYDAVDDFDSQDAGSPEELKTKLEEIAAVARETADEYEAAAAAILSSFSAGNPTSDACEATATELNSWADELDGWEPSITEPDEGEDREDMMEALRHEAQEIVDDAPEYQS